MAANLFRTKSPDLLLSEAAAPERQLKRALSAFDLTCVGIGAIIGAGIFALAGTAAAGEQIEASLWKTPVLNFIISHLTHAELVYGRPGAGPAVMLSFVVAAVSCGFAALCYAELASMIPVSGSAYTYSYATLGEIVAWVIGWDLILEYAVGNMAVAVGWSGYFVQLCGSFFHLKFPLWLVSDYRTASNLLSTGGEALNNYSSTTLPVIAGHQVAVNLPALLIVAGVTVLLVYGIRESARTNTAIVVTKVAVVVFVIAFGGFMLHPTNWQPFLPNGVGGMMSGAAIVFFAFIGFDAVSTTAEETKNPQRDMPIGIIASLIICTVLYVLMAGVITGMRKYTTYFGDSAAVATAFAGRPWAQALISAGALAGLTSVLLVFQLGQPRIFMAMARDGLLPQYFARIHSKISHATYHDNLDRRRSWRRRNAYGHWFARRPYQHRNVVRLHPGLSRRDYFTPQRRKSSPSVPRATRPILPASRRSFLLYFDAESPAGNVGTLRSLAGNRSSNLFPLQRATQQTAPWHRCRADRRHSSADH